MLSSPKRIKLQTLLHKSAVWTTKKYFCEQRDQIGRLFTIRATFEGGQNRPKMGAFKNCCWCCF